MILDSVVDAPSDFRGAGKVSKKNLDFYACEDSVFYKKMAEYLYRRQLIASHGFRDKELDNLMNRE